jgi:hypothetical protein
MTEIIGHWLIGVWLFGAVLHLGMVVVLVWRQWRNRGIRNEGPPVEYWPMDFRPWVGAGVVLFWPLLIPVALVLGYALLFGKDLMR